MLPAFGGKCLYLLGHLAGPTKRSFLLGMWFILLFPALERLRQKDSLELKVNVDYLSS